MNNGFIKLYRCLEESFIWSDSEAVHLWIQLLINANHKEKEVLLSGNKVIIKSGQFVCSRRTLSLKTGINESKIQRLLTLFKSEQMIEQQTNSKYRIITVLNWSKYQSGEQAVEQQMNSKRTANEQQVNTNKNDKNEKKEEKDTIVSKKKVEPKKSFGIEGTVKLTQEEYDRLVKDYGQKAVEDKIFALEGWLNKGNKSKSDNLTIRNWLRREAVKNKDPELIPLEKRKVVTLEEGYFNVGN